MSQSKDPWKITQTIILGITALIALGIGVYQIKINNRLADLDEKALIINYTPTIFIKAKKDLVDVDGEKKIKLNIWNCGKGIVTVHGLQPKLKKPHRFPNTWDLTPTQECGEGGTTYEGDFLSVEKGLVDLIMSNESRSRSVRFFIKNILGKTYEQNIFLTFTLKEDKIQISTQQSNLAESDWWPLLYPDLPNPATNN